MSNQNYKKHAKNYITIKRSPCEQNIGIDEQKNSYQRLIMFMADQAFCFDDKEGALEWIGSISVMMDDWNSFMIPGTE